MLGGGVLAVGGGCGDGEAGEDGSSVQGGWGEVVDMVASEGVINFLETGCGWQVEEGLDDLGQPADGAPVTRERVRKVTFDRLGNGEGAATGGSRRPGATASIAAVATPDTHSIGGETIIRVVGMLVWHP